MGIQTTLGQHPSFSILDLIVYHLYNTKILTKITIFCQKIPTSSGEITLTAKIFLKNLGITFIIRKNRGLLWEIISVNLKNSF